MRKGQGVAPNQPVRNMALPIFGSAYVRWTEDGETFVSGMEVKGQFWGELLESMVESIYMKETIEHPALCELEINDNF